MPWYCLEDYDLLNPALLEVRLQHEGVLSSSRTIKSLRHLINLYDEMLHLGLRRISPTRRHNLHSPKKIKRALRISYEPWLNFVMECGDSHIFKNFNMILFWLSTTELRFKHWLDRSGRRATVGKPSDSFPFTARTRQSMKRPNILTLQAKR